MSELVYGQCPKCGGNLKEHADSLCERLNAAEDRLVKVEELLKRVPFETPLGEDARIFLADSPRPESTEGKITLKGHSMPDYPDPIGTCEGTPNSPGSEFKTVDILTPFYASRPPNLPSKPEMVMVRREDLKTAMNYLFCVKNLPLVGKDREAVVRLKAALEGKDS